MSLFKPPRLRRVLNLAGTAFAVLGVGFIAVHLGRYGEQLEGFSLSAGGWLATAGLIALYAAANVLLALAWWCLLAFLGVRVRGWWAVRVYGLSLVAKYVPGNIFHLAGRQAMGMAAGLPAGALAKSAIWELGLIACVGVLFCLLAMPILFPWMGIGYGFVGFISLDVLIWWVLRRKIGPLVARAFMFQLVFLCVFGIVSLCALMVVEPAGVGWENFLVLIGGFVVAWLAGLVTPGAPAGVGVRELVIVVLLSGQVAEFDLILATILGRMVTVGGDLCFVGGISLWSMLARRSLP